MVSRRFARSSGEPSEVADPAVTMRQLLRRLDRFIGMVSAALLVTITFLMIAIIMGRLVGFSPPWLWELSRILFIWLVFVGGSIPLGRRSLAAVDTLLVGLNAGLRRRVFLASECLMLVCLGGMVILGIILVWSVMGRGQLLPGLGIRAAWMYIPVPVGCFLMMIFAARNVLRTVSARETN